LDFGCWGALVGGAEGLGIEPRNETQTDVTTYVRVLFEACV
jgi:hypothetical protein